MAVLEGSPHDPDVIDRIAQEARGWLLYARELVAFLAEDGNAFHNRLELFASCEERCLAVYDTQELRPFVDTLWKDHLSEYLGDALSTSDEDATDLLNSLLSYIPDPPGPHHVTPRILSVLTGCSSTKVLDSLYPFRTIIVSDRFDVDSAFYFLHPIIRVFIADHSAIKSPRQPSVPWDTIQLRLTICCARVVLDTLESVPHDALSSTSSLQIYADTHPPPPVSDRGELRFAFNHLMDKPVNQALIDSMPGDEGRASLEAIMRIYGPVFEELYLWLCVVPGMAANS
ncbi:hypothetical protein C8Q80DRAFT_1274419 [Daedaleopsis nitida]|nr:hypothetical protein C8Q80DRAFT_1274419 [Daedaleopsis nitida]